MPPDSQPFIPKPMHRSSSRSRTSSRAGTPLPQATTPARLIPPVLHSAPSLSSLRVYSHAPTPISMSPPQPAPPALGTGTESSIPSSAASVVNVPLDSPAEGILVPEPELEVEIVQGNATGRMDGESVLGDEEAKKNLREQLRRTLSQKTDHGGACSCMCRSYDYSMFGSHVLCAIKRVAIVLERGERSSWTSESSIPQVGVLAAT